MNENVTVEVGDVFEGVVWDDEDLQLDDTGRWTLTTADGRTGVVTVEGEATTVVWHDGSTSTRRLDGETVVDVLHR